MIYSVQRLYSFFDRLKSGAKKSLKGIKLGALLVPGNIILALCGKSKASLIVTGIGAGIGAGIGFYLGWNDQKNIEEHDELKKDPKFQKKEKSELKHYIKDLISKESDYPSINYLKSNNIPPLRPDFYRYHELYSRFRKKFYRDWTEAWKDLGSMDDIDYEFDIVFPMPYPDIDSENEDSYEEDGYVAANYYSPSDHYWIFWNPKKKEYSNDAGSGKGRGKTLLEASQNFAAQWIEDENKIADPSKKEVAKKHNKIINEFLKLR